MSEELTRLFMHKFSDTTLNFPGGEFKDCITQICGWIDDTGFSSLLSKLSKIPDGTDDSGSYRFLAFLSWLKIPFRAPPFLPRIKEIPTFLVTL
jgi:hypothetical protein